MNNYDLSEHRHRFAVWSASRAASVQFRRKDAEKEMRAALHASTISSLVLSGPSNWPVADEINTLHATWAGELQAMVAGASYGRIAKLIALYLKVMIVLGGYADHEFGQALHPPVDSILLRNLSCDLTFSDEHRRLWLETRWTTLAKTQYFELIETLRAEALDKPAFWCIERYWKP